jgi:hypothetical protein
MAFCSFILVLFISVLKFVIYEQQVGGHTLFLTGEGSRFLAGSAKCEVFNEADLCTFLMCNISKSFSQVQCLVFFE